MRIQITEDQSYTLFSDKYDEYYHCKGGALAKAKHIFLGPIAEFNLFNEECFRILEVGFGAGLNFFVTADAFSQQGKKLDYYALENDLLCDETLNSLHYEKLIENKNIYHNYLLERSQLPPKPKPGDYNMKIDPYVNLNIILGEALEAQLQDHFFNWIYLDAFSPRSNPELWSEEFLEKLCIALKAGGGLTSYCVNGEIRRRLKRVGFTVEKRPGIPYKREVLLAVKV